MRATFRHTHIHLTQAVKEKRAFNVNLYHIVVGIPYVYYMIYKMNKIPLVYNMNMDNVIFWIAITNI